MIYREVKELEVPAISEEAARSIEDYLRQNGRILVRHADDMENIHKYFFMNTGAAVGLILRRNSLSIEVVSHDELALKLTLEGVLAVAARESI